MHTKNKQPAIVDVPTGQERQAHETCCVCQAPFAQTHAWTRRTFIQTAAVLPAALVMAGCRSGNAGPSQDYAVFFSPDEKRLIDAATARLIPSDENGPGATEAAVSVFIDRQLAGPYGRAATWYMDGPWHKGESTQGYQLKLTPAQLYRSALRNLEEHCRRTYNTRSFADLKPDDQDTVLKGLEVGDIQLNDVPAKTFFALLWQNTQEGFLADPMYGGNRGFAGWKLIGFPGPRYNYIDEISQYGKPYPLPTVGILGRDGTRTLEG